MTRKRQRKRPTNLFYSDKLFGIINFREIVLFMQQKMDNNSAGET